MDKLGIIFLVFFFVLEALAAFWPAPIEPYRLRLVAGGLASLALAMIFAGIHILTGGV